MKTLILLFLLPFLSLSQTPQISGILVNSCGAGAEEGLNEIVTITNGSSSLNINDINITFPNGGSYCNSGCSTRTLVNNATFINTLNTLAGCTLFQFATTIPAGAKIIVFTGLNPTEILNFSSECANAPIYAIFCNNTSGTGRFSNSGGVRTLSINFGGGNTDDVSYNGTSANTGDNGDFVSFDGPGNATYGNLGNCALPLPIELIDFTVKNTNSINRLQWETASEMNNDYFIIENSVNGYNWNTIGTTDGAGNSTIKITYELEHRNYKETINYYKLTQVDFDGEREAFNIIAIDNSKEPRTLVRVVNLMGQEVGEYYRGFVINVYSDGTTNKELK